MRENFTKGRISITKKNKQTDQWEDEFSGFVNFYGTGAASKAAKLNKGDRIKLGDIDVQARYVKEKNTTYYNFNIYSFEVQDGGSGGSAPSAQATVDSGEIEPEDDLPF